MNKHRWYLTVVAVFYLTVGGLCLVRYLLQDIVPSAGFVSWYLQALCLASVVASALYLFRPGLGRRALMTVFALITFSAAAEGHVGGVLFHSFMLLLTCLPLLGAKSPEVAT
jgi:hypothetical protein